MLSSLLRRWPRPVGQVFSVSSCIMSSRRQSARFGQVSKSLAFLQRSSRQQKNFFPQQKKNPLVVNLGHKISSNMMMTRASLITFFQKTWARPGAEDRRANCRPGRPRRLSALQRAQGQLGETHKPHRNHRLSLFNNVHLSKNEENYLQGTTTVQRGRKGSVVEPARPAAHHLYLSMRHFGCPLGEDVEIYFSLYDMTNSRYLSEKFLVKVHKAELGFSSYVGRMAGSATLFTELGSADLKKDLHLVVQVVRLGRILYADNKTNNKPTIHVYRRPHAVAVMPLFEVLNGVLATSPEEKEFSLKLYTMNDDKDYGLWQHELAGKKGSNNKFNLLSGQLASAGLVVTLRLLKGELDSIRQHEYIQLGLKSLPVTQKIGHADVIMPGDVR